MLKTLFRETVVGHNVRSTEILAKNLNPKIILKKDMSDYNEVYYMIEISKMALILMLGVSRNLNCND